jgi:hypothetical protein
MDFSNVKAIAVNIDVDEERLTQELESIPKFLWDSGEDSKTETYWNTIWLTKNNISKFEDFKTAKTITHDEWSWNEDLDIPYIRSLVSSLPIKNIGMIRAFILDGPLPMHVDTDDSTPNDMSYSMGLTIASKLEQPMSMQGDILVEDKNVFFNDSIPHGFPTASGKQISIRIFGEFDYYGFSVRKVYQ